MLHREYGVVAPEGRHISSPGRQSWEQPPPHRSSPGGAIDYEMRFDGCQYVAPLGLDGCGAVWSHD